MEVIGKIEKRNDIGINFFDRKTKNSSFILIFHYLMNVICVYLYAYIWKQGYKVFHEFDKGEKGHHDKEDHKKVYDEKKGEKEKKHEEEDHYDESHQNEEGDKGAKFDEEGKHQKGYSTKGEHSVFKKVYIKNY